MYGHRLNYVSWPNLVKIGRCKVAERSSGLPYKKNLWLRGTPPSPILPKMGRSRPKYPERCHPLIYPRTPNLVRIGCALPDLFWKDWFLRMKSKYNIGFQPTVRRPKIQRCSEDRTKTSKIKAQYSTIL